MVNLSNEFEAFFQETVAKCIELQIKQYEESFKGNIKIEEISEKNPTGKLRITRYKRLKLPNIESK